MSYESFLATKRRVYLGDGLSAEMPEWLFPWQAAVTKWALRKGRAAIWSDCGTGKTRMQLAWSEKIPGRVLILAPLCVAEQTVREGASVGVDVSYARTQDDAHGRIVVTNYERLDRFDATAWDGVVLDESSILKSFDGKTRSALIAAFAKTRYKLCCTATPSPNDIAETANHAEFLGLMTRPEFLATWFIHDDTGWRMKKHAVAPFYRWLASWAVAVRKPSDLGYSDDGYVLPPLNIHDVVVPFDGPSSSLFPELATKGIQGRLSARRGSLDARVQAAAELASRPGQWLLWCGLNQEADALAAMIPDAVNVQGSDSYAEKVSAVLGFQDGSIRVLVTKAKVLGFGMNFQNCHQMAFVGISDSYEAYYQAIRRCWRFGQPHPVDAYVVVSEAERSIVQNVRNKEAAAGALADELLKHMRVFERREVSA